MKIQECKTCFGYHLFVTSGLGGLPFLVVFLGEGGGRLEGRASEWRVTLASRIRLSAFSWSAAAPAWVSPSPGSAGRWDLEEGGGESYECGAFCCENILIIYYG